MGGAAFFSSSSAKMPSVGKRLIEDRRIPLISATGSTRMGRIVGETVARRLGRTLLELGGNNGVIVMNDANLDLALRAVLFGAVGTAGQRCTSIRRLFLQRGIAQELTRKLQSSYAHIRIGDPLDEKTLMGPLIDRQAVETMRARARPNPRRRRRNHLWRRGTRRLLREARAGEGARRYADPAGRGLRTDSVLD